MIYEKICTYLKNEDIDDMSGFSLVDHGNGVEIETWQYAIPQPTMVEVESVTKAEVDAALYAEKRRNAYPDIGDQLDAIWKGGMAHTEMQQQIQQVKDTYPKPE